MTEILLLFVTYILSLLIERVPDLTERCGFCTQGQNGPENYIYNNLLILSAALDRVSLQCCNSAPLPQVEALANK